MRATVKWWTTSPVSAQRTAARESFARIGRLTHILTPHVRTPLTPVAAHAHMQNRGTPPVGYVSQA